MSPKPKDFLWGVSTSAYQSEGGYNGEGEPLNNWVWAERARKVTPSGTAAGFWKMAKEDFARCEKQMGTNAFRLGVEWSRVQPGTEFFPEKSKRAVPPPFDETALAGYAKMIADCRAHGMEPVVTLHHFIHPAWLGPDAWLETETVDLFLVFVERTLKYFREVLPRDYQCTPPRYFITINEPNLLAPNHYLACFPTAAS
jgi:beta-glucosidase